jgi:hypothetical protein
MYAEGSRLVGLEPHECLFIDDDRRLVAKDLGYQAVTLDRATERSPGGDVITSLGDLLPIIRAQRTATAPSEPRQD